MPPLLLRPIRLLSHSLHRTFTTTPRSQVAKITIVGRLGAEPELMATSTGQDLVRYRVATSHGPPNDRQTSWWRVVQFGEGGRDRLLGLGKGSLLYLEGQASMRTFEKEGKVESSLNIVQQRLEVLERRGESRGEEEMTRGEEEIMHSAEGGA